jgi:uncharacterized protein
MRFQSVTGMGRVSFITERAEKYEALKSVMRHYTQMTAPVFDEEKIDRTTILRLDVEQITGKRRP